MATNPEQVFNPEQEFKTLSWMVRHSIRSIDPYWANHLSVFLESERLPAWMITSLVDLLRFELGQNKLSEYSKQVIRVMTDHTFTGQFPLMEELLGDLERVVYTRNRFDMEHLSRKMSLIFANILKSDDSFEELEKRIWDLTHHNGEEITEYILHFTRVHPWLKECAQLRTMVKEVLVQGLLQLQEMTKRAEFLIEWKYKYDVHDISYSIKEVKKELKKVIVDFNTTLRSTADAEKRQDALAKIRQVIGTSFMDGKMSAVTGTLTKYYKQ